MNTTTTNTAPKTNPTPAPINRWLAEPLPTDVDTANERLRRLPDVRKVAVMPDVHLGRDVCNGIALATRPASGPPRSAGR